MKTKELKIDRFLSKSFYILLIISVPCFLSYVQKPTLVDYFVEKIDEFNFTNDAKEYVREYATMFIELASKENLNEVFKFDPINNEYTVYVDKIKDPALRNKDWSGSVSGGSPNLFGKHTGKKVKGEEGSGKKKYAGMVAVWLYDYIKLYGYPTSN